MLMLDKIDPPLCVAPLAHTVEERLEVKAEKRNHSALGG
jgi:hypothetical protein